MPTRERRARGILKAAIDLLPATTRLYDYDHRSELDDGDIRKLLAGKRDEVETDLDEGGGWEMEADAVEAYVKDAVADKDDYELLRELDLLVELEDEIRSRNTTGPLQQLLAHTGDPVLRFDLGLDIEPGLAFDGDEALTEAARDIAKTAGIDLETNRKPIAELLLNADGGQLQVLFSMDLEALVDALAGPAAQISFTDPVLLIIDRLNGSGMEAMVSGTVTRPLRAEDLRLDAGPYSWADIIGGHSRGDYSAPVEITRLPADAGGE